MSGPRPQQFDRAAAKRDGWKDEEIDAFLAQQRGGSSEPGNIDLKKRPVVKNQDGSISTVRSMSFGENGREILVPTVAADGSRILSDSEAIDQYHKTGQHLGKFPDAASATAYAQQLHEDQQKAYAPAARDPMRSLAPSESTGATRVKMEPGTVYANDPVQVARALGQGASLGFGDEIEAGVRSLGSDRKYSEIRDDIRGQNANYKSQHPAASLAANVAGGLLTGGAGVARMGAVRGGAAIGGLAGLGSGEGDFGSQAGSTATGLVAGGVAGAVLPGIMSVAGSVGRAAKTGLQGIVASAEPAERGLARRALQRVVGGGHLTEEQAAERVIQQLKGTGKTVAGAQATSASAPEQNMVGEMFGRKGVDRMGTQYRYGREAKDQIGNALDARAADEAPLLEDKIRDLTGYGIRDAKSVADEAMAVAKPVATKGYGAAYAQPDVDSPEVVKIIEQLADTKHGRSILDFTRELGATFDSLRPTQDPTNTISIQNLNYLRRGFDEEFKVLKASGRDDLAGALWEKRKVIDGILKKAGGTGQEEADAAIAAAHARGESFATGEQLRSGMHPAATTDEGLARAAGEARDRTAVTEGAASNLQSSIRAAGNGTTGAITNPGKGVFSSPRVESRAALAFNDPTHGVQIGPATPLAEAKQTARQITERLKTRNAVMGGSQTAERHASDIDEIGDAISLLAKGKPAQAAHSYLGRKYEGANRVLRGQALDAEARLMTATGAERQRVLTLLEQVADRLAKQGAVRRTAGGIAGQQLTQQTVRP